MEIVTKPREDVNGNVPLIIEGTGEILMDKSSSGRVNPWVEYKKSAQNLAWLFEKARAVDETVITSARLQNLRECADWLKFVEVEGKRRLYDARFCRLRLCPICNWRRSMKMYAQLLKMQNYLQNVAPNARYLFLTFTVRNVEVEDNPCVSPLHNALENLSRGWREIYDTKLKKFAPGYMRCVEVTYNRRAKTFHPHLHVLLQVTPSYFAGRNFLSQKRWQEIWKWQLELDYNPVVDVRAVDLNKSALCEIGKYPLKTTTFDGESLAAAIPALINLRHAVHGRKFVSFGGSFFQARRAMKLDDIEHGDLIHVDDKPIELSGAALVLFKYNVKLGAYIC